MNHFSLPTRPTRVRAGAAVLTLLLAGALTACGEDSPETETPATNQMAVTQSTVVEVSDQWVRATKGAKDTTMSAAFMTLENTSDSTDVELVGARSEVADTTELHEMVMVDGDMVMQEVEGGLTVAAGKGQLLIPGGNHVMLMGLESRLVEGDEIDLVLVFADGSELEVTAPVKKFTEEEGHYHAPGTPEHTH